MRWLLTFIIASIVLSATWPLIEKYLGRFGVGRVPGDFKFKLFNRVWFFPLGTTLVLSFLFWLVMRGVR